MAKASLRQLQKNFPGSDSYRRWRRGEFSCVTGRMLNGRSKDKLGFVSENYYRASSPDWVCRRNITRCGTRSASFGNWANLRARSVSGREIRTVR